MSLRSLCLHWEENDKIFFIQIYRAFNLNNKENKRIKNNFVSLLSLFYKV